MKKHPQLSVVMITYNGAATIAKALDSLMVQDYPRKGFEIIVIDDGSTDNTPDIVSQYPVRYFRQANAGISAARNAGLKLASGEIYVSMDDDCVVSPNYLSALAAAYVQQPLLAGAGVELISSSSTASLAGRYIACGDHHPVASPDSNHPANLLHRALSYLSSNFSPQRPTATDTYQVSELYGANSSFRVEILRAVGGWDKEMSGIEDRDLSRRIMTRFPSHTFAITTAATISPLPDLNILQHLLRPWRRGPVTLKFYQKNHLVPPFFPFPIITICLLALAAWSGPLTVVLLLIATPPLLYQQWPKYAVAHKSWLPLYFSYIQAIEEALVIAGLLRGYAQQTVAKLNLRLHHA